MLDFNLPEPRLDPILDLIGKLRDDPRPHKLDLGVGVYRDATGATPIMRAVKAAEARLHTEQRSKSYLGLTGDISFVESLSDLLFSATRANIAGSQTPGGSGALRQALELYRTAFADGQVWLGDPTWPNHGPLIEAAGAKLKSFNYFSIARQELQFDAMMAALSSAQAGDAVLLHGCCHNPTGAEPSREQWQQLAALLAQRDIIPIVDLAYHGLGLGLEQDLWATHLLINSNPRTLIAASCSKNFALYRDRVGAVFMASHNRELSTKSQAYFGQLARTSYSMPPDHGAAVVDIILRDETLKAQWHTELKEMNTRIRELRSAIHRAGKNYGLDFVEKQRGMFTALPLNSNQVDTLVRDHAVYVAPDGRINIAGCQLDTVQQLVDALLAVGFSKSKA